MANNIFMLDAVRYTGVLPEMYSQGLEIALERYQKQIDERGLQIVRGPFHLLEPGLDQRGTQSIMVRSLVEPQTRRKRQDNDRG